MMRYTKLFLIQEHWLFQCQIDMLGEIHQDLRYAAKGVDIYNELQPTKLPRGYGGVGILWHQDIDQAINIIEGGNERIQAVELLQDNNSPILIVSVYMPTGGGNEKTLEYQDTIDMIYELIQKYQPSHYIILGGDLNEDLTNNVQDKRKQYLIEFIDECNLKWTSDRKTFINVNGIDCSEIDYFLIDNRLDTTSIKWTLNNLPSNTSDHHPIFITINGNIKTKTEVTKPVDNTMARRIRWDKIDKEEYQSKINSKITKCEINFMNNIEESVNTITNILEQSAAELLPYKGKRKNKPKLKVWNQEIAEILTKSRLAHRAWREAGKPTQGEFIEAKKNAKKNLRRSCRVEIAIRNAKRKEEIINARTGDTRLFHKLIKSQRKHSNQTEELLVGNDHFCGPEQILQGFKIHFENLAKKKQI